MIPKKVIKKINALELTFMLPYFDKPYHAVVLASQEKGVSVKPFFTSAKERTEFCKNKAAKGNCTVKEVREELKDPTFCFLYLKPEADKNYVKWLLKTLDDGGVFEYPDFTGFNPSCPFA